MTHLQRQAKQKADIANQPRLDQLQLLILLIIQTLARLLHKLQNKQH